MLSGPGGSVVVLNGPDGKFVVDTFVAPAWPKLKQALDGLGNAPVKCGLDPVWGEGVVNGDQWVQIVYLVL